MSTTAISHGVYPETEACALCGKTRATFRTWAEACPVLLLDEAHAAWTAIERFGRVEDRIRLDRVLDPTLWRIPESHVSEEER